MERAGGVSVLSELAELCLVYGKTAQMVALLRRIDMAEITAAGRWRDTCEAIVDAAPALLLDGICPLLAEIRSLFRRAPQQGWGIGAGDPGVGEGVVEEEALAVRLCLLQGALMRFSCAMLKHARERTQARKVRHGEEQVDSSRVEWKECREMLEDAVVACERVVSTSKEVLRVLGLSFEYRLLLPNFVLGKGARRGEQVLRALKAEGYVRLLPLDLEWEEVGGCRPEHGREIQNGEGALVVLASMPMMNEVDDHCAERVRAMLGSSFSCETTSRGGDRAQGRGHLVRIWLRLPSSSRSRAVGCEAQHGSQDSSSYSSSSSSSGLNERDWRKFVDELWGPQRGDAHNINPNVLYVEGLEALQEGWWGSWNTVVECGVREEGDEDAGTATELDEGSAVEEEEEEEEWICVVTVDHCDSIERETADFEEKMQSIEAKMRSIELETSDFDSKCERCTPSQKEVWRPLGEKATANSKAVREALLSLRLRAADLKRQADSVMGIFENFWHLTFETGETEEVDIGSSRIDEKMPEIHEILPGWDARRLKRAFSREQQRVLREALRGEARSSMPQNEWSFWISAYVLITQERHLTSLVHTSGAGSQTKTAKLQNPCIYGHGELWRTSGEVSEEDARLIQLVLDVILLASNVAVSRVSSRPMILWATVRVWLVSKLYYGRTPPHAHVDAAVNSTIPETTHAVRPGATTAVRNDLEPCERRAQALAEVERTLLAKRQELMKLRGDEEDSRHLQRAVADLHQAGQTPSIWPHEPQSEDQSGHSHGHWYKQHVLGSGSFAKVFRGFWWKPHGGVEFIAIKELNEPGKNKDKIEQEVKAMSRLKHTNLVRMYNYSITATLSYILMEYCPDGTLRDLADSCAAAHQLPYKVQVFSKESKGVVIKRKRGGGGGWKRYVQSTVVAYLVQILHGMEHMHEQNMLHRDLKTSNILLADHGRCAKISDFGETHAPEGQVPSVRMNDAFTVGHVPPEFFWLETNAPLEKRRKAEEQAAYAYQADVWAFGCLAVEIITGHHPEIYLFEMRGMAKENQTPTSGYFCSTRWARTSPELLRLDYREHPLIKSLPEFKLILNFLNACFEVEPKNRKSAAQLLEMPLLQKGRQPQF